MPVRWTRVVMAAVLQVALAACSPSPEHFQPANPIPGGVQLRIGGCAPAAAPCGQ